MFKTYAMPVPTGISLRSPCVSVRITGLLASGNLSFTSVTPSQTYSIGPVSSWLSLWRHWLECIHSKIGICSYLYKMGSSFPLFSSSPVPGLSPRIPCDATRTFKLGDQIRAPFFPRGQDGPTHRLRVQRPARPHAAPLSPTVCGSLPWHIRHLQHVFESRWRAGGYFGLRFQQFAGNDQVCA